MSFIFTQSPPTSPVLETAFLAQTVAESVLDSPNLSSYPPARSLAREVAQHEQKQHQRPSSPGLKTLAARAKERSKRRESFGPTDGRSSATLDSVFEDVEEDEGGATVAAAMGRLSPFLNVSPRLLRRKTSPSHSTLRVPTPSKTIRVIPSPPSSNAAALPLTPPESPTVFTFNLAANLAVDKKTSTVDPWIQATSTSASSLASLSSASSSSCFSDDSDSASNSSADESCTTPTSCSSFGYQQDQPSLDSTYFQPKKRTLPGSQGSRLFVPPAVGSELKLGSRNRRSSAPLPKNEYALKAVVKERIDLILPSLAARKSQRGQQQQQQQQQEPQRRSLSAPLPTLSEISARLQPVRRNTAPPSITHISSDSASNNSRLPAFLLARRLASAAAALEKEDDEEEEKDDEEIRMVIPVPFLTVTPPPERVEGGKNLKALLARREVGGGAGSGAGLLAVSA